MAGWKKLAKPWSTARIMTAIGMASSSLSRYAQEILQLMCWNSSLPKLVEKIIPAFEKAHGPGYQALIMVDNSQGHSAYSQDALVASRMNVKPGGKQAHMHDTWYVHDGQRFTQTMNFACDHAEYP